MQLNLPFSSDEQALLRKLEKLAGLNLTITLTHNRTVMLSARSSGGRLSVRLHRIFLQADDAVLSEIAAFIRRGKGSTPGMRDFIRRSIPDGVAVSKPRRPVITAAGRFHNLVEIFESVNGRYFAGRIKSSITWGTAASTNQARRKTLGSYDAARDLIRISRVLDKKSVPKWYVSFIVYHEMLHADIGIESKRGRRVIHSREFRRREMLHPDYERALLLEKGKIRGDEPRTRK